MKKIDRLLEQIRKCIETGRFLDTRHAFKRQSSRLINRLEVLYVLQHGYHEKRGDRFEEQFRSWNYAVRGKTIDSRHLRIIVSFEGLEMLIITAIDLTVGE